jgi:diaminopimelate decarboxylase
MSSTDIYNEGFYRNEKGSLMCENYEVQTIAKHMVQGCSPFYLMSRGLLNKNYQAYEHALEGIQSFVGYAVKANHNLNLLKYLASMGCGAVVVSGCELQTALIAGFSRHKMVFDGSGKTQAEINLAVENGILVNIESEFDLEHIIKAS